MPYLGEFAALTTALCWLGSSLAFAVASRAVGAQATNQFRLYAALPLLFGLGLLLTGTGWPVASPLRTGLLILSGIVGLTVGDFCFFHALGTIGPRLASVIMSLWPAFTVALDGLRGVLPSAAELVGIGLTVTGVSLVLLRSREGSWRSDLTVRQWLWGIVGAVVGALGQAGGFVLAGLAMQPGDDLPAGIDPLLATIVRMVAATACMQLVLSLQGRSWELRKVVVERRWLVAALLGTVCGPVIGVWLSMVARRHAEYPGVAAALMATTPVFMLPVAILLYRARVGLLGVAGTVLAVAGVAVCLIWR